MKRRSILLVAPVVAAGACGGPPPPAVLNMTIKASSALNENQAGTGLAVAVRLYGLNARGRFMTADAYALMDRDSVVLGDEGSRVEEIVVRPGETRNITIAPKTDVRFIGAVVLFRNIDQSQWRAIAPIATTGVTRFVLALGANSASLEAA